MPTLIFSVHLKLPKDTRNFAKLDERVLAEKLQKRGEKKKKKKKNGTETLEN